MKTEVIVERRICDICGDTKEACHYQCLGCKKDICYECLYGKLTGSTVRPLQAVVYHYSFFTQGSGDGHYCLECDAKLTEDPLHKAYVALDDMKKEYEFVRTKMLRDKEVVEEKLHRLVAEYGVR